MPLLVNVRIHGYTCSPIEVECASIRVTPAQSACLRAVERGAAVTVASIWGVRSRHEPIEGRRALRKREVVRRDRTRDECICRPCATVWSRRGLGPVAGTQSPLGLVRQRRDYSNSSAFTVLTAVGVRTDQK